MANKRREIYCISLVTMEMPTYLDLVGGCTRLYICLILSRTFIICTSCYRQIIPQ